LSDRGNRYQARLARASHQTLSMANDGLLRPLEAAEHGSNMETGDVSVAGVVDNGAVEEVQSHDLTSDVLEGASDLLKLALGQEDGGLEFERGLEERIAEERG